MFSEDTVLLLYEITDVIIAGLSNGSVYALMAVGMTLVYGVILGLAVIPFAEPLLGFFLKNPETRDLAHLPLVLWALVIGIDAAGLVLMNSLIGAGDTRRSMWISVLWQWAFFMPLAWVVGPVLGYGLLGVWIVNGIYRVGQALNCAQQWRSRKWARIEI